MHRRRAFTLIVCALFLSAAAMGCDSGPRVASGDGEGKAKREMLKRYVDSFQPKGNRPARSGSHK